MGLEFHSKQGTGSIFGKTLFPAPPLLSVASAVLGVDRSKEQLKELKVIA